MKLKILLVFLLFYAAHGFAQSQWNATDNITVNVSIAEVSEITVNPTQVSWLLVSLGAVGGEILVDVINTGSVNVTNMYAFNYVETDEPVRPYGSTDPSSYAATGVVVINNETNFHVNYSWVGRYEWNHTEAVANIVRSAVTAPASEGFYRNNSLEYVWLVGNGTNLTEDGPGLCNTTGTQFAIEDDIDVGTAATRTPTTSNIVYEGNAGDWGVLLVNRTTSPLYGQCVAINHSCEKIKIYKYDKRTDPNFNVCSGSAFLRSFALTPNEIETIALNAYIPRGLPVGNLTTGLITIVAG
jgi:hypothetical protein